MKFSSLSRQLVFFLLQQARHLSYSPLHSSTKVEANLHLCLQAKNAIFKSIWKPAGRPYMTMGTSYSEVTLTLMIYSEDFGIEKLTFAVIKQPFNSNSLPFRHYKLVTEHSFNIQSRLICLSKNWIWENYRHFWKKCSVHYKIINSCEITP